MDRKIVLFEASIDKYVTESDLPPTVKKMILEKILGKVSAESAEAILKQMKEEEENAESI